MLQFFSNVLGSFLDYQTSPKVTPATPATSAEPTVQPIEPEQRVVGLGAPNESMVLINDIPMLFVEEPDCVMHFEPTFGFEMRPTKLGVGLKMLPDLFPHWEPKARHEDCSVKEAIAAVIKADGTLASTPVTANLAATPSSAPQADRSTAPHDNLSQKVTSTPSTSTPAAPEQSTAKRSYFAAVTGRVNSWGEEKFPNPRAAQPGESPFYKSFAMRVQTSEKEEVLQGEGLKDAIATSGCVVGAKVSVKRLRKEKVQAFTDSGQPKMKDGQPVFHDKWVWQINVIK
jgi:hypothetical protein